MVEEVWVWMGGRAEVEAFFGFTTGGATGRELVPAVSTRQNRGGTAKGRTRQNDTDRT